MERNLIQFDFTRKIEEQDPVNCRPDGATQVLPWLWLGGENDAEEALKHVDLWIDFRNEGSMNRRIYLPEHVAYIRMPFFDRDLNGLRRILPKAKLLIDQARDTGEKVFISCHAGYSRSAVLALWCLAEMSGYEEACKTLFSLRPYAQPNENFNPFLQELQNLYQKKRSD